MKVVIWFAVTLGALFIAGTEDIASGIVAALLAFGAGWLIVSVCRALTPRRRRRC